MQRTLTAVLAIAIAALLLPAATAVPAAAQEGSGGGVEPPERGGEGGGIVKGVRGEGARKRNPSENPNPDPMVDENWLEQWQRLQRDLTPLGIGEIRQESVPPADGLDLTVQAEVITENRGADRALRVFGDTNLPKGAFLYVYIRVGGKRTSAYKTYIERDGEYEIEIPLQGEGGSEVLYRGYYRVIAKLEPGQQPIRVREDILEKNPRPVNAVYSLYLGNPADEAEEHEAVADFYRRLVGFPEAESENSLPELMELDRRRLLEKFEDEEIGYGLLLEVLYRKAAEQALEASRRNRRELGEWEAMRDWWIWESIRLRSEYDAFVRRAFAPKYGELRQQLVTYHDLLTKWGSALSNEIHDHLGFPRHKEDELSGTDASVPAAEFARRMARARAALADSLQKREDPSFEARGDLRPILADIESWVDVFNRSYLMARDRAAACAEPGPWGNFALVRFPETVDGQPYDPEDADAESRREHGVLQQVDWRDFQAANKARVKSAFSEDWLRNVAETVFEEGVADDLRAISETFTHFADTASVRLWQSYDLGLPAFAQLPEPPAGADEPLTYVEQRAKLVELLNKVRERTRVPRGSDD